jgi:hypothetical protein
MADGEVQRRNNANQFYDLDEIGVITFEPLKGAMQAKFEIPFMACLWRKIP